MMGMRARYFFDAAALDPVMGRAQDLDDAKIQKNLKSRISKRKSRLLLVTPPCISFFVCQNLRRPPVDQEEWDLGMKRLEVAVHACRRQHRSGRDAPAVRGTCC